MAIFSEYLQGRRKLFHDEGAEEKSQPPWLAEEKKLKSYTIWLKHPKTISKNEIWTRK